MKIKEITAEELKNLGNYESKRLTVTAAVEEGENVDRAVDNLQFYTKYKLNEESRSIQFDKITKELEDNVDFRGKPLNEDGVRQRKDWLEKYHTAVKRAKELEFINGDE